MLKIHTTYENIEIKVKDYLPIRNFQISSLDNVVLLAGPNGIGKTRLIQA
jgi:predicted ATPase